jgi:hypothetical protein
LFGNLFEGGSEGEAGLPPDPIAFNTLVNKIRCAYYSNEPLDIVCSSASCNFTSGTYTVPGTSKQYSNIIVGLSGNGKADLTSKSLYITGPNCYISFSTFANKDDLTDFKNYLYSNNYNPNNETNILDAYTKNNNLSASTICDKISKTLSKCVLNSLSADQRFNLIKAISNCTNFSFESNTTIESLLMLIYSTPDNQIESLLNNLNGSNNVMKNLCEGINNYIGTDNYSLFINELFKLYLKKYEPVLKQPNFTLPDENLFYWMDNGMLNKIKYDVLYYNGKIGFRWKYRSNYYTDPVKVSPFDIICVDFQTDLNFISLPQTKRVVYMPAFVFAWIIKRANETSFKEDISTLLNIAGYAFAYSDLKVLSGTAKKAIKFIAAINAVRATTSLVLLDDDIRKSITYLPLGPQFLIAFDKIDKIWDTSDFTVKWFNGEIDYFEAFTIAWDKMVNENSDIDFATKYPQLYNLVNQIKGAQQ